MCIDIAMIFVEIVTCHFSQICNRVMTLEKCQIFVSAQYPKYELISHVNINAFIKFDSMLGLLCIIFDTSITVLFPLIDARVSFPLNIL